VNINIKVGGDLIGLRNLLVMDKVATEYRGIGKYLCTTEYQLTINTISLITLI